MDSSHKAGVERFLFLGSSCIYPRDSKQPIKEEYLLTGPLEKTNSAYAVAKIAGIELIKSYRRQYNHRWISLMPTNVYGPRDNFSIETGHVLPALINKFVTATERGISQVSLWGSGKAKREFIHSRDLAEATLFLVENYDSDLHINVGTGTDQEIRGLANLIASKTGYTGDINWDSTKPDGTPRKLLDVSRINELGWKPKVTLEEGVPETIKWFKNNESRLRS
jgi:GDP-L-fucose synthase